jgi:putative endonuclease
MRERLFHPYIAASQARVLYIGMTGDLQRRIWKHEHATKPGFTAHYRCTLLVRFQTHPDLRTAIRREKILKGWGRKENCSDRRRERSWTELSATWGLPLPSRKQILLLA